MDITYHSQGHSRMEAIEMSSINEIFTGVCLGLPSLFPKGLWDTKVCCLLCLVPFPQPWISTFLLKYKYHRYIVVWNMHRLFFLDKTGTKTSVEFEQVYKMFICTLESRLISICVNLRVNW